ncbi:hypothetical protein VE00_05441 [Pseudogymnoascus sp. WSF 3629]|nr:hypothetical protein VE00_05441 [Pseudogymnoascus sp. WSF 3629]
MNTARRRTHFDTEQETEQAMAPNNQDCKRCKLVTDYELQLEKDANNARNMTVVYKSKQAVLDYWFSIVKYIFLAIHMIAWLVHVYQHGFTIGDFTPISSVPLKASDTRGNAA